MMVLPMQLFVVWAMDITETLVTPISSMLHGCHMCHG